MIRIYLLAFLALATATPLPLDEDSPFPRHVNIIPKDDVDYRLPTTIVPHRYNIKLVPFITEGNFTFKGDILMSVQAVVATDVIVLHANKLTIDNKLIVVAELFTGTVVPVTTATWAEATHFFTINLGATLVAGAQYTISISNFVGVLDTDMAGFYRSSYSESGVTRWLATTQFEATDARRAFPCFDEPGYKVQIALSISRPSTMRAIANMPQAGAPVLDTVNTDVVRYWDQFQESPPMSTYLVAFIVSDFVFVENAAENLRIYAQPNFISQARYALEVSPPLLNWLSEYTGIDFFDSHLPKMDEAAIPDFDAGAMENWGLVTYRERLLLFEEGVSTSSSRQSIATVIAHEYAHQWFGDLVTPSWWKYIWLNEGFATYFESFATAKVEPEWRLEEQFVVGDVQGAMQSDAVQTSHPMTSDVTNPSSISGLFDGISYSKAGSVIRMMEHIVSPATFQKGLTRYLNARSFDSSVADDLFNNMNDQLHEDNPDSTVDVKKVMDTWSLQMGYPVLKVTRDYVANTAVLTQSRFLYVEDPDFPDTHVYKWDIPLTYTTKAALAFEDTSPKDWFNAEDDTKTISGLPAADWVVFNIGESSYYRVNYDDANWKLLTDYLVSASYEGIHLLNRAQLIDDSFNLARTPAVAYSTPLALSKYLVQEVDYIPWSSSFNAFSYIDRKINNSPRYNVFKSYLLGLMNKLYTTLGFDEVTGDGHVTKLNRAAAVRWACNLGDADCISKSKAQLASWISTGVNQIKPDLKSPVYCAALKNGVATDWDFIWNKYLTNTVATESTLLISALGCSKDKTKLDQYMTNAVTEGSPIRRQDSSAVFSSVYTNPDGVDIALDFVIREFQRISTYNNGMGSVGSLMINIANRCSTQAQINKMQGFLTASTNELGTSAAASVQSAIDIAKANNVWASTTGEEILQWITDNPLSR